MWGNTHRNLVINPLIVWNSSWCEKKKNVTNCHVWPILRAKVSCYEGSDSWPAQKRKWALTLIIAVRFLPVICFKLHRDQLTIDFYHFSTPFLLCHPSQALYTRIERRSLQINQKKKNPKISRFVYAPSPPHESIHVREKKKERDKETGKLKVLWCMSSLRPTWRWQTTATETAVAGMF